MADEEALQVPSSVALASRTQQSYSARETVTRSTAGLEKPLGRNLFRSLQHPGEPE
jgi:hypothetical protein